MTLRVRTGGNQLLKGHGPACLVAKRAPDIAQLAVATLAGAKSAQGQVIIVTTQEVVADMSVSLDDAATAGVRPESEQGEAAVLVENVAQYSIIEQELARGNVPSHALMMTTRP